LRSDSVRRGEKADTTKMSSNPMKHIPRIIIPERRGNLKSLPYILDTDSSSNTRFSPAAKPNSSNLGST
jgi:hypothetical protein